MTAPEPVGLGFNDERDILTVVFSAPVPEGYEDDFAITSESKAEEFARDRFVAMWAGFVVIAAYWLSVAGEHAASRGVLIIAVFVWTIRSVISRRRLRRCLTR